MGAPETSATAQVDTFFAEYTKSIEGIVALGRQAIEKAAQQNDELIAMWKKGLDATADALKQSVQAQRDLVAVGSDRLQVVSRLVTENVESVQKTVASVAATLDTLGVGAAVQRQFQEVAAAQKTAFGKVSRQVEENGNAALDTFQRGVNTAVETGRTVLKSKASV